MNRRFSILFLRSFEFWVLVPVHKQRLTSPRGKFEITNMADDQVDLTPEDIPGASFIEEEIRKLTVFSTKVLVKMPPYKSKW